MTPPEALEVLRAINQWIVKCRFNPSRQMLLPPKIQDHPNYHDDFAEYAQEG